MAKYGSQLRYPYVMLELMNSWDEELSNCESMLLLKTIKSGWANGLTKNVSVKCKLNYVGYCLSRMGAHSPYYNGLFQVYRSYQVHVSHRLVHT